jgi:hypothetical protein
MPRRRTSNRPLKRRIKLNTQQDAQSEMGKVYRAVDRGDMSPSEGTRRVFMLDKLRASGLPDARAKAGGGYAAPVINVFSVPSGYFLSLEQIEAHNRGEHIIDVNDCKQLALEPKPQLPMLEVSEPVTIEIDAAPGDPTVVDFPATLFRKPDDGDHAA